MRKVSLVFIVLGLSVFLLNVSAANEPPMDKKGKWGISLSTSGLSNLGIGLYQGGIGVKHWFSNGFALRTILGIGARSNTLESINPGYTDEKTTQGSFSLNLGTVFHFLQDYKFSPYFYTGTNFTTTATTYYYSIQEQNPPPGRIEKRHISTNSFGMDAGIGLEYFFNKHFSLTGEYLLSLAFQTDKDKTTVVPGPGITQPAVRKISSTTFGAKTSSLILTVYF